MVRRRLPHEIIASSRETDVAVVVVVVQEAAAATVATTVVRMVDHTEGRHQARIGGATSCCWR